MKLSKEFKVALLAIVSFTALYLGFNYLKGQDFFSPYHTYYAVYDNIAGLTVSNPVSIKGFTVGRVREIKLMQKRNNQILVAIDLNQDIMVGDSAVAILTSDFLGNKRIEIQIGNISKPIKSGDTIMGVLDKGIADLLTETAKPIVDNIGITIQNINSILDSLAGSGEDFKILLANLKELSSGMNHLILQNQRSIHTITTNLATTTEDLNTMLNKDIRPILKKVDTFTDSLNSLDLAATLNKTNEALENLNAVVTKIDQGNGSLSQLINSDTLYVNLNNTLLYLDTLLIHINAYPKHFFGPLGKKKKKIEKDLAKDPEF